METIQKDKVHVYNIYHDVPQRGRRMFRTTAKGILSALENFHAVNPNVDPVAIRTRDPDYLQDRTSSCYIDTDLYDLEGEELEEFIINLDPGDSFFARGYAVQVHAASPEATGQERIFCIMWRRNERDVYTVTKLDQHWLPLNGDSHFTPDQAYMDVLKGCMK